MKHLKHLAVLGGMVMALAGAGRGEVVAALQTNPKAEIYNSDGKHPSSQGTYLAACLFYALMSGQSPEGLPATVPEPKGKGTLATLSAADASFCQGIAETTARAVQ